MATRKIVSKHIAQSASSYVGRKGELILDTVTNELKISDGSTSGGTILNTDGSSGAGGGSVMTVQDEGSALSTAATTINFVGSGVVASGTGATKTITIAGVSTGDIGFSGNRLKTSSSNADLELDANGSGSVVVMSPTFTIKDENFNGSPTIRDFTNDAFDMYNTLNINKKPSGAEGIRVDTYNAGYNVKSTTNSGSSTITNFKFNFAELTNGTEAERVGTLRFDSGIDNGGSLSQSVNMDFIPTNSGESGSHYYSFKEDGLHLGGNVANIKNFGSPGYIGFDWIRVDGVDLKDNTITTNSSNADLELSANGTGFVKVDAPLALGVSENDGSSVTINLSNPVAILDGAAADGSDKTYTVPDGTQVGQILYLIKGRHDGGDGTVAHKDSVNVTFGKTVGISGQTTVQTNLTRVIFGQVDHLITCIWRGDAWIISKNIT